jgi:hypothetical protein
MPFNSSEYVQAKTILSQYGRCPQETVNMAEYVRFVDIQGVAAYEWSQWPAKTHVNVSGNRLLNVSGIQFSDGTYIGHGSSFDISSTETIKITAPLLQTSAISVATVNGGTPYTSVNIPPHPSIWSIYGASQNVSLSGYSITNVNDISVITVNGGTPYTTVQPPPHPSTWSTYGATQNVSLSGYSITNVNDISASTINGGTPYTTSNPQPQDGTWNNYRATNNISLSGHSITNVNDISASTINGGTPYTTANVQPALVTAGFAHSRTIYVDASYGNDTIAAAAGRYSHPYKTVEAATAAAVAGDTVLVFPGTYTLSAPITIKTGTSIRGISVQTTTLQYTASSDTILINAGPSTRIEDLTINLTSTTSNLTLIGVDFSGSSTSSKLRTAVVNVSTVDTSSTVIGVRSSGTTSIVYASSDAVRSSTINVNAQEDSVVRGLYCTGPNRISLRDVNIYADGGSNNAIGVEIISPSGVIYLRSCSCFGTKADISQPVGKIYLGSTDLVNSNANGYDFTTIFSPVNMIYGMYGKNANIAIGTYYLYPGTWSDDYLTVSGAGFITPSQICIHHMSVLIKGSIPTGATLIATLQKNMIDVSGMVVTIPAQSLQGTYNINNGSNKSQHYMAGDKITIKVEVSGAVISTTVAPIVDLSVY